MLFPTRRKRTPTGQQSVSQVTKHQDQHTVTDNAIMKVSNHADGVVDNNIRVRGAQPKTKHAVFVQNQDILRRCVVQEDRKITSLNLLLQKSTELNRTVTVQMKNMCLVFQISRAMHPRSV